MSYTDDYNGDSGSSDGNSDQWSPSERRPEHFAVSRYIRGKADTAVQMPVMSSGQYLDYSQVSHIDISYIASELPPLHEGAYAWSIKFDVLLKGVQLTMYDFKGLISWLVGMYALDHILNRAGLQRYIGTTVNDGDRFEPCRALLCRALRDLYPTNVHPNSIIIDHMGETESPIAYIARVYHTWRVVTGNNPELLFEQVLVRGRVEQGLPEVVRRALNEVVGLSSMDKALYIDHVAHYVNLYRKKLTIQTEQDAEMNRALVCAQLASPTVGQVLPCSQHQPPHASQGAPRYLPYSPLPGVRPPRRQGLSSNTQQRTQSTCYICGENTHFWRQCNRGDRMRPQLRESPTQ